MFRFTFYARGHENIKATHKTTLEITRDRYLTPRGDCIVAVSAEIGLNDLPQELKKEMKKDGAIIKLILEVENLKEVIIGEGSSKLILTHTSDMVCRKSNFICPRTLMIHANKAAIDLSRDFVNKIKDPRSIVKVTIEVNS